ncbi:MAG: helix-turn-helix domain-containing protein [Opitutaceae bacterium]|nr:helix-turn-helix domain-containing protein [Opitutaceae bacterium]
MQSIGERLEEARKRKGVSLREAAEATKIRGDYLQKFENNQYDIKLPEIYVRGFLRTYANYLKLPGDKIVADYNGLGLGEAKPRQLNRELYGRMDIGIETRKAEEEAKLKAQNAAAGIPEEPKEQKKNPATFVPQGGAALDTGIILRIGGIAVGALLIILVVAWALFGRDSSPTARTAAPTAAAPTEPQIILQAKGAVNVTVTLASNNSVLFQGSLRAGESQNVAWRGALRVSADPHQNLEFEIGGKRYPMPNQRTADIRAP